MSTRRGPVSQLKPFDDDSYGDVVWDSRLADELELEALSQVVTRGSLEDRVADRSFDDGMTAAGEQDEEPSSPKLIPSSESAARQVWSVLQERQKRLGALYRFIVTNTTLRRLKGKGELYLSFLAVAWAHAVSFRQSPPVEVLFEDMVAAAVAAKGLRTAVFRRANTHQGTFPERLVDVGNQLGLRANPSAAAYRTQAKDAGVDVIARLDWEDARPGQWWLLGQATCARSESWSKKMLEPKPQKWSSWFDEELKPQRFLALPHHVTRRALQDVLEEGEGFVLDRLRLVLAKPPLSRLVRRMTKAVLHAHAKRSA